MVGVPPGPGVVGDDEPGIAPGDRNERPRADPGERGRLQLARVDAQTGDGRPLVGGQEGFRLRAEEGAHARDEGGRED